MLDGRANMSPVSAAHPPTSLADVVDIALAATTYERTTAFGPIPLTIRGERPDAVDNIVEHLAPSSRPRWRPLDVVTITDESIDADDLPVELRPITGDDIRVARSGPLTAVASGAERSLWVLDPERSIAVRWVRDAGVLPLWEHISPLRSAARWWATEHGASMVHTGAVADDRGGILLVGDAGAGKSTTTMACLGSGLEVLGDDFCFVEPPSQPDESPTVHVTYRLAKLDDRSLDLLPHLRSRIVGTGLRGKSLIELDAVSTPERAVRAVCHVVQRPAGATEVEAMSRVDALRAVAPSTMFQVRLFERETWAGLAASVRVVPCFRLLVGDLAEVPTVLGDLLDQVGAVES